ncbi:nuclear transport factor 2 family protein [Dactylosporangium sp. NPDC000244]|uniref:nuclear transport factor 2 family protein n=1 Tax=Dactylosporangium sp. NPDC000244 TaxID=3154365 RepID=UPI0033312306|nr:nuclear transport factor 2 family protein [Dactylosporangium thailandense]
MTDEDAIRAVVCRYCRGIDRLDMELVRSCYHPGGIDHHTGFDGPIEDYIAWVEPKVRGFDGTQHLVANHLVEVVGDRALSETYGMAVHWGTPSDDPKLNFTSGFRFVDVMERRCGEWRILERFASREWTRSDAGAFIPREGPGPAGRRDREDHIYRLRDRLLTP